jgi:spermidine synthase
MPNTGEDLATSRRDVFVLVVAIFIAGVCSIVYELLISTVSSYFLGDTIKQFSIIIGMYMAAMGLGAYLSRLLKGDLIPFFIKMEIALGFIGGVSVPFLYTCYALRPEAYPVLMPLLVLLIGVLIGVEIPLLARILDKYYVLKINISTVLSVDYVGALVATILFPFILLPLLGTFRSSLVFGVLNMGIGFIMLWRFSDSVGAKYHRRYLLYSIVSVLMLLILLLSAQPLIRVWSQSLYEDQVIFQKRTPYQQLVLTKYRDDLNFFINGNLQFSSRDEYRYHEALVHIPMAAARRRENVLVLGGGDGLAVREILKYKPSAFVTVVDLDPEVVALARRNPLMRELNEASLDHPQVMVFHTDAYMFLESRESLYDVILADLPDPNNVSLARLYSREFYDLAFSRLTRRGVFATQSTSPYYAKNAFWCIYETVRASRFENVVPYHVFVPSFGDWGFVVASKDRFDYAALEIPVPTQFLGRNALKRCFQFEKDIIAGEPAPRTNTLDDPQLLHYYLESWRNWR